MAPVIRAMAHQPDGVNLRVCVTAQHREMLDDVLRVFQIQPDYDLDLMQSNRTLAHITAHVLVPKIHRSIRFRSMTALAGVNHPDSHPAKNTNKEDACIWHAT